VKEPDDDALQTEVRVACLTEGTLPRVPLSESGPILAGHVSSPRTKTLARRRSQPCSNSQSFWKTPTRLSSLPRRRVLFELNRAAITHLMADKEPVVERSEASEEEDASAAAAAGEEEDTGAQVAPIVRLEEVLVTTGEEDEDVLLDM
jgi:hypothetical protein